MILTPVNNRFLNHTNPIMTAALTDGGSVLDREYIQRAARGIVDAGHLSNLKFWGCAGLAKLRNSGGVDYVPKLYDLSGNGNHGVQTTKGSQPVWGATGLTFDGSDDTILVSGGATISELTNRTLIAWCYLEDTLTTRVYLALTGTPIVTGFQGFLTVYSEGQQEVKGVGRTSDVTYIPSQGQTYTAGWYLLAMTFVNEDKFRYYLNTGELSGNVNDNGTSYPLSGNLYIGTRTNDLFTNGKVNDIRIYNTALTGDQIAAIYNQTSYRYA